MQRAGDVHPHPGTHFSSPAQTHSYPHATPTQRVPISTSRPPTSTPTLTRHHGSLRVGTINVQGHSNTTELLACCIHHNLDVLVITVSRFRTTQLITYPSGALFMQIPEGTLSVHCSFSHCVRTIRHPKPALTRHLVTAHGISVAVSDMPPRQGKKIAFARGCATSSAPNLAAYPNALQVIQKTPRNTGSTDPATSVQWATSAGTPTSETVF